MTLKLLIQWRLRNFEFGRVLSLPLVPHGNGWVGLATDRGLFADHVACLFLWLCGAIDRTLRLAHLLPIVGYNNICGHIHGGLGILSLCRIVLAQLGEAGLRRVAWGKGRNHVLLAITLLHQLPIPLRQLADLLLGGVLRRCEQVGLVIRIQLQMLDFLLAV